MRNKSGHYENSRKDKAEDRRGAKALGVSLKDYESTPRDRREDDAGEHRMRKSHKKADHHPHFAGHRHAGIDVGKELRQGPQPGPHEFSAPEEMAMRQGAGPSAAPTENYAGEPDEDDLA